MGRSKFPGKPSKHIHRKRVNVLPPTGEITNIECSSSVTVDSVVENKQVNIYILANFELSGQISSLFINFYVVLNYF